MMISLTILLGFFYIAGVLMCLLIGIMEDNNNMVGNCYKWPMLIVGIIKEAQENLKKEQK